MTKYLAALGLAASLTYAAAPAHARDDWRDWQYQDTETVQKSFDVSKGSDGKRLYIGLMNGYVHVTGGHGSQIKVTLHKETRGRSQAAVAEGKRDVNLEMDQQSNYIRLTEDAPWRNRNGDTNYHGADYYGYHVALNVDVEVPDATYLELHSFNDPVEVKNTNGDYTVKGFNGDIKMEDVSGSGSVNAFNGHIDVTYRQNPQHDSTYKTFNGTIDVHFQPSFNADLRFKTFHGDIFSDFDVQPLPEKVSGKLTGGRYLFRSNGGSGRVGSGGPSLSFETFNGRISMHTK